MTRHPCFCKQAMDGPIQGWQPRQQGPYSHPTHLAAATALVACTAVHECSGHHMFPPVPFSVLFRHTGMGGQLHTHPMSPIAQLGLQAITACCTQPRTCALCAAAGGRFRGRIGRTLFQTAGLFQSVLEPDIATNKVRRQGAGCWRGLQGHTHCYLHVCSCCAPCAPNEALANMLVLPACVQVSFKLFGLLPGFVGLRGKVVPVGDTGDTVRVLFEPPVLSLGGCIHLRIGGCLVLGMFCCAVKY
jgi:hypothetical protein